MAVETRNPLPAGRYWIDVSKEPKPLGTFEGFLSAFADFIHVESTEDDPEFSLYIFNTSKPLVWPEGIGYPTIAGADIKSRADTVQRPDPEKDVTDVIPTAGDLVKGASNALFWLALVVGGAVVFKLLGSGQSRTKP
jgi:hypothetical protein